MKKKILIGVLSFFVLLVAAVILLPVIYKDKIVQAVKDEANNNLHAKVDFGAFDITIFSSFPNLTLSLNDLKIIGINEFEGDTLTYMKNLAVTIDIMSVIKGDQFKIRSIDLKQPVVNALVLKDGKANWDIAKASADSTTSPEDTASAFSMALKKLEITNGRVVYDDRSLDFRMELHRLNHTLSGDFTDKNFLLQTQTTADALNMWYGGVRYMNKVKTAIKVDMDADMPNFKFTFKNNEVQLNELIFGFDGFVAMPKEDIEMDVKMKAHQTDFKNFISMVPGVYVEGFKDVKTSGKLGFDGYAKGIYGEKSMPAFGLTLQVADGMFKYPSLPASVNNVAIDLKITNPDGVDDHTVIDLSKFHVDLGQEPFDARLMVKTPVSDPQLDAWLKGKVNLENIQKMVPLEAGTQLTGTVTSDLTLRGRMSSVEQQRYEEFFAAGQLSIMNFSYAATDMPSTRINNMQLTFNPQNVTLGAFDAKFGKSDLQANGTLDNFLAYALKDEMLKGTLNVTSSLFDLNEWMSGEEETASAAADTVPLSVIEVPRNIDFNMSTRIGKVLYDEIIIENLEGNIIIRDETVSMNNVSMNMFDGKLTTSGSYQTKDPKKPFISYMLEVVDFDIQKTVNGFKSVKEMAPIAEKAYGKYSTHMSIAGNLDEKMEPVMNTLVGGGRLQTKSVVISDFGPITKMAEALKMEKLKKGVMQDMNLSFKFKDGRVAIDPFDATFAGFKSVIEGSNGFDQSIDYKLNFEIPRSEFGGAANGVLNDMVSKANSKGANLSLGETVNVNVLMGGTVIKPVITTSLKEMSSGLKDKGKELFDQKKQEALDKGKAEAEKLKAETEAKLKAEQEKAKAEAERLKKEAEDKAKAEAEKAKKEAEEKMKKEAEKKFKGLLKK